MLQYPLKFDMILSPFVHTQKGFISYSFVLYCKEPLPKARSITTNFILELEKLLPVNSYFEITKTLSGVAEIKVIFTFPKGIYKSRGSIGTYNNIKVASFETLITETWYNNLISSKSTYIPKKLSYKENVNYIPYVEAIRGDLEKLIRCKTLLMSNFINYNNKVTKVTHLDGLLSSYLQAYRKFKVLDSFAFLIKLPVLNKVDNYLVKELIYNLSLKIPVEGHVAPNINRIKGEYILYLHVQDKLTNGRYDNKIKFKDLEFDSLLDAVKKEWNNLLLQSNLIDSIEERNLVSKEQIIFTGLDINNINVDEYNTKINEFINTFNK